MRTTQKFYTKPKKKKNELHHNENLSYKQKKLRNIEMDKNSLSCSRVSARLVVHQIAELQLTALLQKSATKFYNHAPIFPPDSL